MPANPKAAPDAEINKTLGEVIRQARIEEGQTQVSIAANAGLSRSYYAGIERGERNISIAILYQVGHALGIEGWELLRRAHRRARENLKS